jgi:hypothetical protein
MNNLTRKAALASTIPATSDRGDNTQLVFRKFGNDYFLSRIAHEVRSGKSF